MKRLIWNSIEWAAWALVESAFRMDCRGPFALAYRAGNALYQVSGDLGERWGFLVPNPRGNEPDQPFLIRA